MSNDISQWIQNLPLSTDLATQEELGVLSNEVVDGLSNTVNPKLSTIAGLISSEVEKLDKLSGNLSSYVKTEDLPTDLSDFTNSPGYLTAHQDLSDYAKLSDISELPADVVREGRLSSYLPLSGTDVLSNIVFRFTPDRTKSGAIVLSAEVPQWVYNYAVQNEWADPQKVLEAPAIVLSAGQYEQDGHQDGRWTGTTAGVPFIDLGYIVSGDTRDGYYSIPPFIRFNDGSKIDSASHLMYEWDADRKLEKYLPLSGYQKMSGPIYCDSTVSSVILVADTGNNQYTLLTPRSFGENTTVQRISSDIYDIGILALGNYTSAFNWGIAIGDRVLADNAGIAIGGIDNTGTSAIGDHSIAIGYDAGAIANHSVQIGKGTNNSISSIKYGDRELFDSNGFLNKDRLPQEIAKLSAIGDSFIPLSGNSEEHPVYGPVYSNSFIGKQISATFVHSTLNNVIRPTLKVTVLATEKELYEAAGHRSVSVDIHVVGWTGGNTNEKITALRTALSSGVYEFQWEEVEEDGYTYSDWHYPLQTSEGVAELYLWANDYSTEESFYDLAFDLMIPGTETSYGITREGAVPFPQVVYGEVSPFITKARADSLFVPLTAYQALEARLSALESRLSDIETIVDQINGTN